MNTADMSLGNDSEGMPNINPSSRNGWPHTYTAGSTSRLNPSHAERRRSRGVQEFLVAHPQIWDECKALFKAGFSMEVLEKKMRAREMGAAPVARNGMFSRLSLMAEMLLAKGRRVPQSEQMNRVEALLILFGERSMTDPSSELFEDACHLRMRIASIAEERSAWADLVDEACLQVQENTGGEEEPVQRPGADWEESIRKRIPDERMADRAVNVYTKLMEAPKLVARSKLAPAYGLPKTTVDTFYNTGVDLGAKVCSGSGGSASYKRAFLLYYVLERWTPRR